ncbi:NDP-sugar synthase [bacterium]|jgi:mannose-1-phosphate guanylyltransferase|nr:NDP-sugar synthase [bacterium]
MHAVVLVGGFGTRLRPLTYSIPKPLLPVAHTSMLERLMNSLALGGVTHAVLALGFKPEPFMAAFPNDMCGSVQLSYAVEDSPLDTAGAIGFAARSAGINETFVVANGDVLTDLDIASLISFHRQHGAEGTISLTPVSDPSQYGIVEIAADGRVERFLEKPQPGITTSNFASAGTYVLEPSALTRMPGDQKLSIERVVFPQMVADKSLFAMSSNDYWIDAGRPDTFISANVHVSKRATRKTDAPIHPTANVDATVVILDSVIGENVTVLDGARIQHSVLLPGAIVGQGSVVIDSLVMGKLGSNSRVTGSIIGSTGVVGDNEVCIDASVPAHDPTLKPENSPKKSSE